MSFTQVRVPEGLQVAHEPYRYLEDSDRDLKQRLRLDAVACYYQDTLQAWCPPPAIPAGDITLSDSCGVKPRKAGFFSWLWSWVTGQSSSAQKTEETQSTETANSPPPSAPEQTKRRPRLPTPDVDENSMENLLQSMNKTMQRIQEMEADNRDFLRSQPNMTDFALLKLMLESFERQRKIRNDGTEVVHDKLFKTQEIKKNLHRKLQEVLRAQQDAAKKATATSWFSTVLTIGTLALAVAGIAFGIVTGGAGIPLAAMIAGSGATIAQGVTTGVKGYYDHQRNQREAEVYGLKDERGTSHQSIQSCLHDLKESLEFVNQCLRLQSQAQRSWQEASRYNQ